MASPPAPASRPDRPPISVIVVSYNSRDTIEQCLRSLIAAAGPADELIVVDNRSSDGSADLVRQTFPRVTLIESQENLGFGAANNAGVSRASCPYIACFNPDTVVAPDVLDVLVQALDSAPDVGMATAKILLQSDPGRINTFGNQIHCSGLTQCRHAGAPADRVAQREVVDAVSGAAFVMRRDLYHQVGGFDESFFMYMEDTDLSLRVRLAGYRCLADPDTTVMHAYALRFGPRKVFFQERNRYSMLLKILHWGTLLLLLPVLALSEIVAWGFVALKDRRNAANKLRAYGWIVRHWRDLMAARRQTQALRRVRDRELWRATTTRLVFEQVEVSPVTRIAHIVFDPLFFIFKALALLGLWW